VPRRRRTARQPCGKGKEFVSFLTREGRVSFCATGGKRKKKRRTRKRKPKSAARQRAAAAQCRWTSGPRKGQFKRCGGALGATEVLSPRRGLF